MTPEERFGLVKTAARPNIPRIAPPKPNIPRILPPNPSNVSGWKRLFTDMPELDSEGNRRGFGHSALNVGRDMVFGSPVSLHHDLKRRGIGGYLKGYYGVGKGNYGLLNTTMGLAPAALQLYSATQAAPGDRARAYGQSAVQLAAAPFTARLGIPGMVLNQTLGNAVNWLFRKKQPTLAPETNKATEAPQEAPQTVPQ